MRRYNPRRREARYLSGAVKDRPQLHLVVAAQYDRDADSAALRSEQVRRDLAAQLGLKAGPQEGAGAIAYDDPATQNALEAMLASRSGANTVQAIKSESSANGADRQKLYEAMFQRLVEAYPLPDTAPQTLANERAQAIDDYLVQRVGSTRAACRSAASRPSAKHRPRKSAEAEGRGCLAR